MILTINFKAEENTLTGDNNWHLQVRILEHYKQALKDDLEMYRLVSLALDKAIQSLKEYNADTPAQVISEHRLIKRIVAYNLCHVVVSPIIFKRENKIESLIYVNKNIAEGV